MSYLGQDVLGMVLLPSQIPAGIVTPDKLSNTQFRNRVINGDMRIDQANSGASVASNSVAANTKFYGPDMWWGTAAASAGVFTLQQSTSTPPTGYKNFLRVTTTTADAAPASGSIYQLGCSIEGLNVVDLALGTANATKITTSLQMRSSLTGTFSGAFQNAALNRSYPWTCTITSANTWTPVVVTLTGDNTGTWATDNSAGLTFVIDLGCGSSVRGSANAWTGAAIYGVTGATRLISTNAATLDITGVQIEKGGYATEFERRSYQSEFALCERYFQKLDGIAATTVASAAPSWRFPVMRAVPTVIVETLDAGAGFTLQVRTPYSIYQNAANSVLSGFLAKLDARL